MTAPINDAPADNTGGGAAPEGLAPAGVQDGPAGPGDGKPGGGDGPRGRRAGGERVRSASRDDDAPQDDTSHHDDDADGGGDDAGGGKGKGKADWQIDDLPAGAQKLIAELRKENGTRRTEAAEAKKLREQAEKKAAEGDDRFAKATQAFMTALGLTPEPDEPERSPEELLGEVSTKYQQTRVELAVYRAAAQHGADPDSLLDSRSFLTKALALDPGAEDFDASIASVIGEAVDGNPKLRSQPVHVPAAQVPSGGDFGGGPAEPLGPDEWSVDDFRRARRNGSGNY